MKLLRIVTATFQPDPKQPQSWEVAIGNTVVKTIKLNVAEDDTWKVLLTASISIEVPEPSDGLITIPDAPRRELEFALETICNTIAVLGRCKRHIASATPSAALIPDDSRELAMLQGSEGIRSQQLSVASFSSIDQLDSDLMNHLKDRLPAVALLAEAQGHSLAAGRFHEYVRLFESAFALPFSQLTKKLRQVLNPVYGYTSEEIDEWRSLRHPMTHADGKKTSEILLDSDVRRYTQRMEQAAYDVLFNKRLWFDRSTDRREVWAPVAATTSQHGGGIIRQGSEPRLEFQIFDEFGVYPKDLNGILTDPPQEWWCKFNNRGSEAATDHER